jgi:hypothetical protein
VWLEGVPPGRQPAPLSCAEARASVPPDGFVVYPRDFERVARTERSAKDREKRLEKERHEQEKRLERERKEDEKLREKRQENRD